MMICVSKWKNLLGAHNVWEISKKGYKKSQDGDSLTQTQNNVLKDLRKRDKKALFLIYHALDRDEFNKFSNWISRKKAHEKLQMYYKGYGKVMKESLLILRGGFESLHMKESEFIYKYF